MKTAAQFALGLIIACVICIVAFFAMVGAVFLYATDHSGATAEVCPSVVHYEDGTTACVVEIHDGQKPPMITQQTIDDAIWLLSKRSEFAELVTAAEALVGDDKPCEHIHTTPSVLEHVDEYKEAATGEPQPVTRETIDSCDDCPAYYSRSRGEWIDE
jgi:hypothetical protein